MALRLMLEGLHNPDQGWKFLKILGSRRLFLISGVKIASLRFPGIMLDVRDRMIILVSTSMHSLRTHLEIALLADIFHQLATVITFNCQLVKCTSWQKNKLILVAA